VNRAILTDKQWEIILLFLSACPSTYVGNREGCRRFLEGVLWILRTGAQWRMLPKEYGNWNSVFKRFSRWSKRGIWEALHNHAIQDADLENVFLMVRSSVPTLVPREQKAVQHNKKHLGDPVVVSAQRSIWQQMH